MIKVALTVDIDGVVCRAIERVHEPKQVNPDYLFDWVSSDIMESFEMLLEEASQDLEEAF